MDIRSELSKILEEKWDREELLGKVIKIVETHWTDHQLIDIMTNEILRTTTTVDVLYFILRFIQKEFIDGEHDIKKKHKLLKKEECVLEKLNAFKKSKLAKTSDSPQRRTSKRRETSKGYQQQPTQKIIPKDMRGPGQNLDGQNLNRINRRNKHMMSLTASSAQTASRRYKLV